MDLKLSVLLGFIDKATAPLRSITGNSTAASKALRETRQRLKELDKTQGELKGFRKLKNDADASRLALRQATAQVNQLRAGMAGVQTPTRKASEELAKAERNVTRLKTAHMAQLRALRDQRAQLSAAGIDTRRLGGAERKLASDIAATTQKMTGQQAKLQQLSQQQQRANTARQNYQRGQAAAAHLTVGGYAAMETGRHVLGALNPTLEEARAFQTQTSQFRALGIGDDMVSDAVKFAKGMDVMGSSATDNLKLLKESYSVLRDMHEAEAVTPYLAQMKFGIEAVMAQGGHGEGHGATAETMFMDLLKVAELRGAAKNPESLKRVLDFATQAYVASGGMVKPEDLLNMIKTGGIAAKQVDDTSFFFGLLHTVQEMGGHRTGTGLATAYQNWAAGRSTQQAAEELGQLGLLNKGSVKYGKTGHITKMLPDALKDGDLYRTNPFEYLMTRVIPKINPDGKLNDQQVLSRINALFSGRKGGDLFASMYLERANIGKQLANAPKAYGVHALYNEGTRNADGQLLELEARKRDLYRELGTQLLPLYVSGLQKTVNAIRSLSTWSQKHPVIAKAAMITAAVFGTLTTVAGGTMIALGGVLAQFNVLRFLFSFVGRMGAGVSLARIFPAIATGARMAAVALAGLGWPAIALLAVITAIAVAVRHYWPVISAWFKGLGNGIAQTVMPAVNNLMEALGPLGEVFGTLGGWIRQAWQWFVNLLEPMQATQQQLDGASASGESFGRVLGDALSGLIDGVAMLVRAFVWVGEAIGNAAGFVVTSWEPVKAWFKDMWQSVEDAARGALEWISSKLQGVADLIQKIRNFGSDAVPAGAGNTPLRWITGSDTEYARQVADMIGRTPMPGALPTAAGNPAVTTNSPVSPGQTNGAANATYSPVFQIDARGSDPDQVHKAVRNAWREIQREQSARTRSAYSDNQ
jgi:hypothetical protein